MNQPKTMHRHTLFATLAEEGLLSEDEQRKLIENAVEEVDEDQAVASMMDDIKVNETEDAPIYIRFLVGASAWFASFFFLFFFLISGMFKSPSALIMVGGLLLVVAVTVRRGAKGDFVTQLCLVSLLLGQISFVIGVAWFSNTRSFRPMMNIVFVLAFALQIAFIFIYNDRFYRGLGTTAAACLAYAVCMNNNAHLTFLMLPAMFLLLTMVWIPALFPWHELWEASLFGRFVKKNRLPIGFGLSSGFFFIMLFDTFLQHELFPRSFRTRPDILQHLYIAPWMMTLILSALWVMLCLHIRKQYKSDATQWSLEEKLIVAGILLFCLASYREPGFVGACFVLTLGFFLKNVRLKFQAMSFLLIFVVNYYYSLKMSLFAKSMTLLLPGLLLIALRIALRQLEKKEEVQHA